MGESSTHRAKDSMAFGVQSCGVTAQGVAGPWFPKGMGHIQHQSPRLFRGTRSQQGAGSWLGLCGWGSGGLGALFGVWFGGLSPFGLDLGPGVLQPHRWDVERAGGRTDRRTEARQGVDVGVSPGGARTPTLCAPAAQAGPQPPTPSSAAPTRVPPAGAAPQQQRCCSPAQLSLLLLLLLPGLSQPHVSTFPLTAPLPSSPQRPARGPASTRRG